MHAEPALRFWLDFVESEGGAVEEGDESALALVPAHLQSRLDLPEELLVTDDPDVAREEGALLAIAGQPVVLHASEAVRGRGDAGWAHLPWPASVTPSRQSLQEAAREQVPVDHGRIDIEDQPEPRFLPVLRVGALVEHRVSLEERYSEQVEVWVDGRTGVRLPDRVAGSLGRLATLPGPGADHPRGRLDLEQAVASALRILDTDSLARRTRLARNSADAQATELARIGAYYDATLASLAKRREGAPAAKQSLYDKQAETTRVERDRRFEETERKFTAEHEVRPFRLHAVGVPGLSVPATVRRGAARFALELEWYLPFSMWVPVSCPQCGSAETLCAGKERLGCRSCLGVATPPVVREPAPSGAPSSAAPSVAPIASGNPAVPVLTAAPPVVHGPASPSDGQALPAPGEPEQLVLLGYPDPSVDRSELSPDAGNAGYREVVELSRDAGNAGHREVVEPGPHQSRPNRKPSPDPTVLRQMAKSTRDRAKLADAGRNLAVHFWERAVFGERWSRTQPRSPLEALYRLYGYRGPLFGIGVPDGTRITRVTMNTHLPEDGSTVVTSGLVTTYQRARVDSMFEPARRGGSPDRALPYSLRWKPGGKEPMVVEVLPFVEVSGNSLPGLSLLPPGSAGSLRGAAPLPVQLGSIERRLWQGIEKDGMPLVVRSLALWWRVQGHRRLMGIGDGTLAAAIGVTARRLSGQRPGARKLAERHRAREAEVKEAVALIEAVLGGAASQVW